MNVDLPWLKEIVEAKAAKRLPVVLTPREVTALLAELNGTMWLAASLLYGSGMRLLESLRLRVKHIEFERREIVVREGKQTTASGFTIVTPGRDMIRCIGKLNVTA